VQEECGTARDVASAFTNTQPPCALLTPDGATCKPSLQTETVCPVLLPTANSISCECPTVQTVHGLYSIRGHSQDILFAVGNSTGQTVSVCREGLQVAPSGVSRAQGGWVLVKAEATSLAVPHSSCTQPPAPSSTKKGTSMRKILLIVSLLIIFGGCQKTPAWQGTDKAVLTDEGYATNCYPCKVEGCEYYFCLTYPGTTGVLVPKANQSNPICR
jgi:hypothetical protein